MPQMNDLVPSIGSSTQTYSASAARRRIPRRPCRARGMFVLISARIAASAARSAAVTGSKPPEWLLFSTPSAVRKNGRIVSPETAASSSTNAAKSIAVICQPLGLALAAAISGGQDDGNAVLPLIRSVQNDVELRPTGSAGAHWRNFTQTTRDARCKLMIDIHVIFILASRPARSRHHRRAACTICRRCRGKMPGK